ncbi:hypothetical protein CH63R_02872 [Colletotrichum higginsianum IMI 349063]|uniref:Uncharacterized protein n=1 Tax=Colletotrichum higginsianum (strain IMI 349063) TaxID=759273 RepID=A0A1B7YQ22_COLHI|nr:hypothetical protein CH63R_02872 [Colletotrichum higginsianum IMI 349063]OBR14146.1 hypothetical protein CH63R_02872 [Colletotrichum higginsianum IMI 349063]
MQAGFLDPSYFEQPRIFGATAMREMYVTVNDEHLRPSSTNANRSSSPGWLAHSQDHSRCLQVNDNEHQWHREVEA